MDLTKGNVTRVLFKFAIPIIILQLLNQAYSLIDSVIVSRFAGGNEFAILSNISSLTMLGYCLVQGGAIASNVVFARLFGSKEYKDLKSASKTFNIVIFIYGTIIALLYCVFAKELLLLIQIPDYLLDKAIQVLIVYGLNFIPVGLIVVNEAVLTGAGDSKTPMYLSIIFQSMNLVLDYIVVAKLNMGTFGAALASLLASVLSALFMYLKGNKIIKALTNDGGKFSLDWLKHSVKLAIPSTISQTVASLGTFVLQIIVNGYGVEIINGYNVGFTLNNVIWCPVIGIALAFESFGSQNLGAKKLDRYKEGFNKTIIYGLLGGVLTSVLTILLKDILVSLYITDSTLESYKYAIVCFLILIGNYYFLYMRYCFDAFFKTFQKMNYLAINATVTLGLRILLTYLLTPTYGPNFLPIACVISNFVGFLIYLPFYFKDKNKLYSSVD